MSSLFDALAVMKTRAANNIRIACNIRLQTGIPLAAERIHRAFALECAAALHQFINDRVKNDGQRAVCVYECLYPGDIKQVIGVLDGDEYGRDLIKIMRAVGSHRLLPFYADRGLVRLCRKVRTIYDQVEVFPVIAVRRHLVLIGF